MPKNLLREKKGWYLPIVRGGGQKPALLLFCRLIDQARVYRRVKGEVLKQPSS